MKLLQNYDDALQALYAHVGFKEDWVICPVDNNTDSYWTIDEDEVRYADSIEELETGEGNCYSAEIYKQRFYDKHIYVGEELTMIFADTHTDGMRYFMFFDNKKQQ